MTQTNTNMWLVTEPTKVMVTKVNVMRPNEKVDVFDLKDGDIIQDIEGNMHSVVGATMEDSVDYLIHVKAGYYSPLFFK